MKKNWKKIATKLAQDVCFALKFLKCSGIMIDMKTGKASSWQDDFMDSLDAYGFKIDREKYWEGKKKKR